MTRVLVVAYGVQPSRIRRIYTNNSVYIIRCAVWRVSKIGRGLFSPVVKTPGCYNGIRGGPGYDSQYARIFPQVRIYHSSATRWATPVPRYGGQKGARDEHNE
jgi:hypothetical protein